MVQGVLALKQRVVDLQSQPSQKRGEVDRDDGLKGLLVHAWHRPEFRAILLATVLFTRLCLYAHYEAGGGWALHRYARLAIDGASWLSGLLLFCKWNALEYREHGPIQLVLKWGLFGGGIFLAVVTFFGHWPWAGPLPGFGFDGVQDVQPWPLWAGLVMLLSTLLTISRFTERLAERVSDIAGRVMERPVFAWVKNWLV